MKSDQEMIDEAMEIVREKNDKFFNYFGLRGADRDRAQEECEQFIKDFEEAKMGHGFFNSPLGRKAFMVGYFRGRASNSTKPVVNEASR